MEIAAATRLLWQARIDGLILENSHGRDAHYEPMVRTFFVRHRVSVALALIPCLFEVECVRPEFCG